MTSSPSQTSSSDDTYTLGHQYKEMMKERGTHSDSTEKKFVKKDSVAKESTITYLVNGVEHKVQSELDIKYDTWCIKEEAIIRKAKVSTSLKATSESGKQVVSKATWKQVNSRRKLASTFEGNSFMQTVYEDSPQTFYGIGVQIAGTVRSDRLGSYVKRTPINAKSCSFEGVASNHGTMTKEESKRHRNMTISVGEPFRTSSNKLVVKELVDEPKAIHIIAGGKPNGMVIIQTTNVPDWDRINLEKHRKQILRNPRLVEIVEEEVEERDESLYTTFSV